MKTIKHKFSGKSLLELKTQFGLGEKGFYDNTWWLKEKFASEKPAKGTYEIVFHPELNNLTYQEQLEKLGDKEEFLHPAILAEAILTYYQKSGGRLMESWWSRTISVDSDGYRVDVGGFDSDGLHVYSGSDGYRYDNLGLSASRKFKGSRKLENLDIESRLSVLENFKKKVEEVLKLK